MRRTPPSPTSLAAVRSRRPSFSNVWKPSGSSRFASITNDGIRGKDLDGRRSLAVGDATKIAAAVALLALLAADVGMRATSMLGEAIHPPLSRPMGAQEERNPEAQRAKTDHNQAEANDKKNSTDKTSVVVNESHPQPSQQKTNSPTHEAKVSPATRTY